MIKFQLFDSAKSYQCHFSEISTFVVSIAHFMRAYFNYQALTMGKNFRLPEDAAYLNVSLHLFTVHNSKRNLFFIYGLTFCCAIYFSAFNYKNQQLGVFNYTPKWDVCNVKRLHQPDCSCTCILMPSALSILTMVKVQGDIPIEATRSIIKCFPPKFLSNLTSTHV